MKLISLINLCECGLGSVQHLGQNTNVIMYDSENTGHVKSEVSFKM